MDNYRYELFRVEHRAEQLYPLTGYFLGATPRRMEDQSDLIGWLKEILSSQSTLKKIDSLLAQAKG